MRKAIVTAALTMALAAVPAAIATPAFAGPVTTMATTVESRVAGVVVPEGWERAGEFSSELSCAIAGAAGQVAGKWRDWDCYYSDYVHKYILWVLR